MSRKSPMPTLFGSEEFWILADSTAFVNECAHRGLKSQDIKEINKLPLCSIIFSFSNAAAKFTLEVANATPAKRAIFCALQVFEPSLRCANYSLDLILKSDFNRALERQRVILNMFNSGREFNILGNGSRGQLTLIEQAEPYALIAEDVSGSFIHSVAEFFEVHYAHMRPQEPCPFIFNGTLRVSGILTVLRKPNSLLPLDIKVKLERLSDAIVKHAGFLTVTDNKMTSLMVGNDEYIDVLNAAAGNRGTELTEFAVGVNDEIAMLMDYSMSSQMNEGIAGVHVAIGDGSSGFHIDFLCPEVGISPFAE